MTAYLTVAELKLRMIALPEYVDVLEGQQPGWVEAQLEQLSRWIDARLRKRYAVPFADPPEIVKLWTARLATHAIFMRRGFSSSDEQAELVKEQHADTREEIREAAESAEGLFDLPSASSSSDASGISKGGPLVYSEQSPYVFADIQSDAGRMQDANRRGT